MLWSVFVLPRILTWEVRELVEEFVFYAVELVTGVVGRRRWGRALLFLLLLLGRPAEARASHADQSHGCSEESRGERATLVTQGVLTLFDSDRDFAGGSKPTIVQFA